MSILIKGMEMPHDCDECRLCAFIPVGDYAINRKCLPLNAKAEITIRRANCPLIEIPPHGRLIDADALEQDAQKRLLIYNKYGDQFQKPYEVMRAIALAPTIISAEEEEYDFSLQGNTRSVVMCKDCRHRDPEDHKCDCGQLERAGCVFPVDDDYFCAYGEFAGAVRQKQRGG